MIERIAGTAVVGFVVDETGVDENTQVLRNGGLGEVEAFDHVLAAAGIPGPQFAQYLQACRMGERGEARDDRGIIQDNRPELR